MCVMGMQHPQVGETEEEERQFLGNYTYSGKEPRETIPVKVGDLSHLVGRWLL